MKSALKRKPVAGRATEHGSRKGRDSPNNRFRRACRHLGPIVPAHWSPVLTASGRQTHADLHPLDLRQHLSVFEHDELVRNLHALLNPMRAPASGASLINRGGTSPVTAPSTPSLAVAQAKCTTNCGYTPTAPTAILAGPASFPPMGSRRRRRKPPQRRLRLARVCRDAGPDFVCDNLNDASDLSTFQRGRHGITVSSCPTTSPPHYATTLTTTCPVSVTEAILTSLISTERRPWSHCLQRFIDACTAVKNSVRPDLRLLIHRGADTPQEVIHECKIHRQKPKPRTPSITLPQGLSLDGGRLRSSRAITVQVPPMSIREILFDEDGNPMSEGCIQI